MPVSYEDISQVARDLLDSTPCTEAVLRSSISRAYYGFFHLSLEYADSINVPPLSSARGPVHATLGAYYQESMHNDMQLRLNMRQVGWSLKKLHELRCKADYRLGETLSHFDADNMYQQCESKIKLLQELIAAHDCSVRS